MVGYQYTSSFVPQVVEADRAMNIAIIDTALKCSPLTVDIEKF